MDDWSLNNQKVFCGDRHGLYLNSDIEYLRKKLIEDFREWVRDFNEDAGSYNTCPTFNEDRLDYIINKRFGVV